MKARNILLAAAVLASLTACSSMPFGASKPAPLATDNKVDMDLRDAAKSVKDSMDKLAEVEQANAPAQPKLPSAVPVGLGVRVNVEWSGPVHNILQRVALASGYTLKVYGKEPAVPVIVDIRTKGGTLYDVLKDAGMQCGKRAMLSVDGDKKVITLGYAV